MRDAFIQELTDLANRDQRVVAITADIGNRMFNRFAAAYPGRFINAGIAEANMTGVAAGMAMAGLRPFTYTIAAFNPGRCLEQIRLDVCQHRLPVVVVGVGGGLSYSSLGPTHHCLEDLAWLRTLPGMTILCPGDPVEVRLAMRAALALNAPVYIRLGKKGEPAVHVSEPDFRIGKAIQVRDGKDAALLAVGTILPAAIAAADYLVEKGVELAVYSLHTVKPLDEELLTRLFAEKKLVAVAEEHVEAGGAWSAVAEWLAKRGDSHVPLVRFGMPDAFFHEAGGQNWVRRKCGFDAESMADGIARFFVDRKQA